MEGNDDQSIGNEDSFGQTHKELVLAETWWWSVHICLCAIALIANLIFIVTVIYNRRRHDLKTFVTAVITTVAFLDILDVARVLPVLSEELFGHEIFRHVYCTLGVFHELAVAIFLVSISVAVCVQAGKETKLFSNDPRASMAHKILIPIVLLVAGGTAAPHFMIKYEKLVGHTCTDPFRVMFVTDTESHEFKFNLYSTVVTVFTYVLPVLIMPLALPIATLRTCISRQCCVQRFKQPIGELIMTTIVCMIYLGTIVGVVLPRIDQMMELKSVELGPAPLLWELGNNAARPLCYFMTNPAVWDGLRALCCRRKNQLVNEDEEEAELPLAPVTTV